VTGQIETQIDRGYLAPETRTAATRYLTRTDNADLLPILGLVGGPGPAERTQAWVLPDLPEQAPRPRRVPSLEGLPRGRPGAR
jgi:hypothetical protein